MTSATSGLPFDDFRELLSNPRPIDRHSAENVTRDFRRFGDLGGSLGRLEDLAVWLAGWSGRSRPLVGRPLVAIFAGSHGVAAHNVSPRPVSATAAQVERCGTGNMPVNQLCSAYDLGLKVFDLALDVPTGDISKEAALDERATAATMAFGMEAIAGGTDLVCVSDFGVGNSTVAAALCAGILGGQGADWVGTGSGADPERVARKIALVDAALAAHTSHVGDPLEVLRRLGGREFAAIAGAVLAARAERVPVILGGFVAVASAAILHAANPDAISHCLLAGLSGEAGEAKAAERIGLKPLHELDVRDGGVAAALAAGMVKAAAACHSGMRATQPAG